MLLADDPARALAAEAARLALRGLEVTAVDLARRLGVALRTRLLDLRRSEERPEGSFDLLCVFRYLNRGLFPWIREAVSPGGLVVFETFAGEPRGDDGPRRRANRLEPGELRAAFEGFEILRARAGEEPEPGLVSILVRRPR